MGYELDSYGNIARPGSGELFKADVSSWFKDTPIFSNTTTGTNGSVVKNMGLADYGLSAFNAWNAWDQGNKMYDLQSDAFEFSQDKFWNNYLQDKDLVTRQKNIANRQIDYNLNTTGMTQSQKEAYNRNQSKDYYKGDRTKEVDGSYTNLGSATPSKYAGTTQTGTPTTSTPVGPAQSSVGAVASSKVPAASQPGSLAAKSKLAGEKPKKITV